MTAAPAGRVGFVGLGAMGRPMSDHLLAAGWQVVGYDVAEAARTRHTAAGGEVLDDLGALPRDLATVVTSLPSAAVLDDVLALLAGVPGRVVVDTSTLALEDRLAARETAEKHGLVLVDCPVSGTSAQAVTGDLIAYLSGVPDEQSEHLVGLVASMTRAVHLVGEFGNGTRMKLVANLLVGVHNLAAAEALLLAQRAGLRLDQVLDAVGDGAGSSRMLQVRGPLMVAGAYDDATARVEIFQKDLRAIRALADEVASPTPLLTQTAALYDVAVEQGRAQQDTACVFAVLDGLDVPAAVPGSPMA